MFDFFGFVLAAAATLVQAAITYSAQKDKADAAKDLLNQQRSLKAQATALELRLKTDATNAKTRADKSKRRQFLVNSGVSAEGNYLASIEQSAESSRKGALSTLQESASLNQQLTDNSLDIDTLASEGPSLTSTIASAGFGALASGASAYGASKLSKP
jgi:hypothetical protein